MSNAELPREPGGLPKRSPAETLMPALGDGSKLQARRVEYTGSREQAVTVVRNLLHPDAEPASARWQDTFVEVTKRSLQAATAKEWPGFEKRFFRELDIAADARGLTLPGQVKGKETRGVEQHASKLSDESEKYMTLLRGMARSLPGSAWGRVEGQILSTWRQESERRFPARQAIGPTPAGITIFGFD